VEEGIREKKAAKQIYREMKENGMERFFYTYASKFPLARIHFTDAYYSSAMIIGVNLPEGDTEQLRRVCDLTETLSMLFQMSWGYPQLARQRVKVAHDAAEAKRKEAEREVEVRLLSHLKSLAGELTTSLRAAFSAYHKLSRSLVPPAEALLDLYKNASPYIPPMDGTKYFGGKFVFDHAWSVGKIAGNEDHFRAQVACVLLSYLADKSVPRPDAAWPANLTMPWIALRDKEAELLIFKDLMPETLEKIVQPGSVTWTNKDESAFNSLLKGCFHYPFKQERNYLTGPLLTLWTLERGGRVRNDVKGHLLELRPSTGRGWPKVELLPAIHGLLLEVSEENKPCSLDLDVKLDDRSKLDQVEIVFSACVDNGFDDIADVIEATDSSPSDEGLGSLQGCVKRIRMNGGQLRIERSRREINIAFKVG
jgi:hypothetical protein